ncbi:MAG: Nif3-like dinuclear metal center hexameric protein [Kiritimatiellae bacterium]|nr:Nif3-like dinuclear metal center hexameric protein [Kiritimatiellia bacterium]
MNTNDIREHLLARAPWVDRDRTVDTVKAGDPQKPVATVGVGWMATRYDLRAAHAAGCDLFITHEPTFYDHRELPESDCREHEPAKTKKAFLDETGMVVLRIHDTWDNWPGIGIRDSWAKGLGLTDFLAENTSGPQARWHAVYRIPETSLGEFAAYVAARVRVLGQDGVEVLGNPDRRVSRPALGVGCGGPDKDMVDLGADVLIVCYDGASYWRSRERLCELGAAVIMVEHGTSEMWGLENLATYLGDTFPELTVQYFAEHPRAWHADAAPAQA